MAGDVAALKDKIQRYLTQSFDNVTIDRDGDFSLRHGSARVFVRACTVESGDWTYVSVWSPFLFEVKPIPELFEYVALHTDDRIFGHLHAHTTDDGVILGFSQRLLGDYLDEEELTHTVVAIAGTADTLDDELQAKFGGKRFHED